MNLVSKRGDARFLILLVMLVPILLYLCQVSISRGAFYSLSIIFGLVVLIVTLVKTEWALVILIFATLLSPEIAVGTAKARQVTLRVEDILLIIISFTWLAKMAIVKEIGFIRHSPLNNAIKIYSSICILATLIGVLRGYVLPMKGTFYVLKYIEYFVLFFLVLNHVQTKKDVNILLYSFFAVCFIISLYSLTKVDEVHRISAPFEGEIGEPNTFGGYLLFMFSISLGLFLYAQTFQISLLFGFLAVLTSYIMLFTLSRGSYLGMTISFLVLFFYTQRRRMLLILAGLCALLALFLFPSSVKNRILYTFSFWNPEITEKTVKVFNVALDPSSSARIESFKWSFQAWLQNPFIGYGVSGRGLIDNQYFTVLVETGLIGFCAFIFLMWKLGKLGFDTFKGEDSFYYKGLFLGYFAGFIGLLCHALTANTFIIIRIMEPFWFITGVMVMLPEIKAKELLVKK